MKGILFIITVVIILGCNTIEPKDINIELLNKEWVHSREEEKDSILVYRPIDYKEFPTSRYRQMYFLLIAALANIMFSLLMMHTILKKGLGNIKRMKF